MSNIPRRDLRWGQVDHSIPPCRVALPVGRNPVRVQVRERLEALRLLVGRGRVRITAGQPRPHAEALILLPAVDDNIRHALSQVLQNPSAAIPLSIFAGNRRLAGLRIISYPPVVERIPGASHVVMKINKLLVEPVLEASHARVNPHIAPGVPPHQAVHSAICLKPSEG